MKQTSTRFRPGDLVEVRSPEEILQTLDADGTMNQLPFMPEMLAYCGRRFRIAKRALKTCTSGTKHASNMRGFKADDVVILDTPRCSGSEHDGCQKSCMILWREAWLRKADGTSQAVRSNGAGEEQLRARLKVKSGPETYFCQASEILNVTDPLPRQKRFTVCLDDIRSGNCSVPSMVRRVSIWTFWRIRRIFLGPYGRGTCKTTPAETLTLQAGEKVVVKPMSEIRKTLDGRSYNRGLWFSPDMRLECGHEKTVQRQLQKIIVDGTGEMRKMKNTVYLEGSFCSCPHVAFGGCPRGEFIYWREIWLQRRPLSK